MNWKLLLPLYLGAAIGPMGGIGIVTVLPVLAKTWSIPFATASLTIPLYMIPFIIVQTFSGSLAELLDTRKTLLFGFGLYAVGGVLCGLSPSLWTLLGSLIIQGVGAAFLAPIIMAMVGEVVPEAHVGRAVGFLGVAYTIGVTLGPLFSGFIEVRAGWPFFFYFLSALSLTAGVLYWATSKRGDPRPRDRASLAGLAPLMRKAATEPGVLRLSFAAFCLFLAYIGIMTFTAGYLKSSLGLASDRIGALISGAGLSGIPASPVAGYLGDRFGKQKVFIAGMLVCLASVALMAALSYSYAAYFWLFLLFGAGAATAWTSLNTMAVQLAPSLRKPVTSVYSSIKFSGYALAPVVLSLLYVPYELAGVRWGCLAAIAVSSGLVLGGTVWTHEPVEALPVAAGALRPPDV